MGIYPLRRMDLDQLAVALDAFASHHPDPTNVPSHHLRLFVEVARLGGRCTYRQLQERLHIDNSSVSRTVHALGELHRNKRPGLGLLTIQPDPEEGRRHVVALTDKGSAFLRSLIAA